ncbi:CDP-alcohol phosphatidyltransferase family protein [Roseospira marina]|uniref:CDP-diacylglycerol--glycerol-3-phosphate 3-phosphatidyltransferase n=2 Tax=Roseospira marina TaxID=140057 RepID=A0A5M6I9D0_9PROT|nr:CDP-alcohol phosphatidyltransferase family protein [Roseospira marina]
MVAPMLWCVAHGVYGPAVALFVLAGVTDALDGALARRLNARSALGAALDPVADKALVSGAFIVLGSQAVLPLALAILVVGRDLAILAGAVIVRLRWGAFAPRPSRLSKLNTAAQILLVAVAMLEAWRLPWLGDAITPALALVVAITTTGSGLGYAWTAWHRLRERRNRRPGGVAPPDGGRA